MPAAVPLEKELSTGAWIALGLIVFFVFFINFSLLMALRRRGNDEFTVMRRFIEGVRRNPTDRDGDIEELHQRVQRITGKRDNSEKH